jgi:hypothetical protein
MPKDTEKYQYFTVGLLKESFALEALKADALKHHMIDQPAKLIALRLTEYYDLLARATAPLAGGYPPATRSHNLTPISRMRPSGEREEPPAEATEDDTATPEDDIVTASADAGQNADEAADYWATL